MPGNSFIVLKNEIMKITLLGDDTYYLPARLKKDNDTMRRKRVFNLISMLRNELLLYSKKT